MIQYVVIPWWPRVRKQRWPDSWGHESASQMLQTNVSQGPFGQRWHRYMALSGKVDNNLNANNPPRQFFWVHTSKHIQVFYCQTRSRFRVLLLWCLLVCWLCIEYSVNIHCKISNLLQNCFASQSNSRVSPHEARKRPRAFSLGRTLISTYFSSWRGACWHVLRLQRRDLLS